MPYDSFLSRTSNQVRGTSTFNLQTHPDRAISSGKRKTIISMVLISFTEESGALESMGQQMLPALLFSHVMIHGPLDRTLIHHVE